MPVEIQALEPSDYDALLALWKTAGLPHRPKGRDSREAITSQMRRDPGLFLGAFLEDRLVGSVIASFDGRKGWINRLAVDPDERRQGIGRKLTEEAERVLRARGSQITGALVEADNSQSLALFEKCGYTIHKDMLYLTKRDSGQV